MDSMFLLLLRRPPPCWLCWLPFRWMVTSRAPPVSPPPAPPPPPGLCGSSGMETLCLRPVLSTNQR